MPPAARSSASLIFPYNQVLTGDALLTPIDQYFDLLWHPGANRLGFGADIGSPDHWGGVDVWLGHSPLEALVAAQFNVKALNVELLGWSIGSLVLLYVHLLWGRSHPYRLVHADGHRSDRRCLRALLVQRRLLHRPALLVHDLIAGPLPLGAGPSDRCGAARPRASVAHGRETVASLVLLLAVTAMISFLPWRATERYWGFRGAHTGYRELAATGALDNAFVFIKTNSTADYGNAFTLNSPDLTGPIFLRDQGPSVNAQIIARYPGRPVRLISAEDLRARTGVVRSGP